MICALLHKKYLKVKYPSHKRHYLSEKKTYFEHRRLVIRERMSQLPQAAADEAPEDVYTTSNRATTPEDVTAVDSTSNRASTPETWQ